MRHPLGVIALLSVAACSGNSKDLAKVKPSDPVWQLNPDRWTASSNDLITPPGDGLPHPLPPPDRFGSTKVPSYER